MSRATNLKDLKTEINILHQIVEIISKTNNISDLLHQIAKLLVNNLKGDSCFIYLLDRNSSVLTLTGAWPPHPLQIGRLKLESGEGITGWVASHKKPVILCKHAFTDSRFKFFQNLPEDKFAAFLSVPIILKEEPTGVINLMNRKSRRFSNNQIKLLTNIASLISGSIEKTKLIQIADQKAKQLDTISQLSKTIVSGNYLQEILQLIVTLTAQMMDSKICSLMLVDEKTQLLNIVATQSLSDDYRKKPPIKVGQSIAGQSLKERKAISVIDVKKEPKYGYPKIAQLEGLCSMLAVPMLIKDKPIGVINCYTTNEHFFTEEEIRVLQTIANQAAVAIENTRLLEEYNETKEALETRKLVERAKGILMKNKQYSEEQAFQFIQKQAMNLRRTMKDVAEAIILSEGLAIT